MRPLGWRHAVALCFWGDSPGPLPIFVVSAERREGRRDFSATDEAGLERIHPFVDCAVSRLNEGGTARTMRDGIAMAMRDRARGFAILDGDGGLVQSNAVANTLCAVWAENDVPAAGIRATGVWRLPQVLLTTCHELRDEWRSAVRKEPDVAGIRRQRSVTHPTVPGLTVGITLVGPDSSDLAEPVFVLEFDRRVHGVAVDAPDHSAALLQGMTTSERAVALIVADGFSNQEIAERLGKTIHAVKFLLHRIYQKTGIPNRSALVAVLRSAQPSHLG
jgi:DNA-binding CsgD family transcriptional regulator